MDKIGVERPRFTVHAIEKAAENNSGYTDFGSDSYLPGLDALLYSIQHEARLNLLGRITIHRQIVAALANRLTLVAWEKANPTPAMADIAAPLIILGLGRTGTTIMQETLASAPGVRTPVQWEITDYSLVQQVRDPHNDSRIKKMQSDIDRTDKVLPGFSAIHYYDAFTPSECIGMTALDLCSEQFSAMTWAPTYRKFLLTHDHRSVYDWHRRALRYFQASTPGVQWILKAPTHSAYLEAILHTYPDAKIINTHRDPVEVIGSVCSLYGTLRRGFSDHVDPVKQGVADATYAAEIINTAVRFRDEHPGTDCHFFDVSFRDFLSDSASTLADIYSYFRMPLSDEARTAMLRYLANRPRDKYGNHTYTLEQAGLTKESLVPLYADYAKRFGHYF